MFDWRKVSRDPTDRPATMGMDAFFRSITKVEETSRLDMILDFCRGQEVLDIGAGEHDVSFFSEEGWEHGRIAKVANRTFAAASTTTRRDSIFAMSTPPATSISATGSTAYSSAT